MGDPIAGRIRGEVTVVLSAPLDFINGERGALVVPLSLARLEERLRDLDRSRALRLIIVDGQSRAFVHPDAAVARQLRSLAGAPEIDAVRRGETGSRITVTDSGAEQLAAFAPIPAYGWAVVAYEPTEQAFLPARAGLVSQLVLLGLAVVIVAALAWFLGGRLVDSYHATIRARLQAEEARAMAEQLNRDLQRALQSRDEYFAAASHDLRNPLTAILGGVQLLTRRFGELDTEDADQIRRRAALIEAAANRMGRLIGGLQDLARLEAGKPLELNLTPTELGGLTARLVAGAQSTSKRHRIRLTADGPVVGDWDPTRLERVIVNLLDNAVKFSPDGGEIEVGLRLTERDGRATAVLEVRDHGVGIPPQDLPRIFDQFHRGSNVVGRISGTGLGLAGARHIVEEHGGRIRVESEVGRGTTVVVELPVVHRANRELGRFEDQAVAP